MKIPTPLIIGLTCAVTLLGQDPKIDFIEPADKATDASKSSGKLLAIVFLSDPASKEVKTLVDNELAEMAKDFIFTRAKFEKSSTLAKKYKIHAAPTIVLVNTLLDKIVTSSNANRPEDIKKALKDCVFSPDWENASKDLEQVHRKADGKPVLVFISDNGKDSKSAESEFSRKMFEPLAKEIVLCKVSLDSALAKKLKADKAPSAYLIKERKEEVLTKLGKISFGELRKAIKEELAKRYEWHCQNGKCGKKFDEPGECCIEETVRREKQRTPQEILGKIRSDLSKANSTTTLEEVVEEIARHLSGDKLSEAEKTKLKTDVVATINRFKNPKLESLKGITKAAEDLKNLRTELDRRKERVQKSLSSKYAREIEDALRAVWEIWEAKVNFPSDKSPTELLADVKKLNSLLEKVGEAVKDDLKDIEQHVSKIGGSTVSVKTFAATNEEKKVIEYNDRVDKYNNDYFKKNILPKECKGVPESILDHVNIMNEYRAIFGKKKLFLDAALVNAAWQHSQFMSEHNKLFHVGEDGSPPSRASKNGFKGQITGENCGGGGNPLGVLRLVMSSPPHYSSMMSGSANCFGFGIGTRYFTQLFGSLKDIPSEIR
jgi:uncharacterized protein YkwD